MMILAALPPVSVLLFMSIGSIVGIAILFQSGTSNQRWG